MQLCELSPLDHFPRARHSQSGRICRLVEVDHFIAFLESKLRQTIVSITHVSMRSSKLMMITHLCQSLLHLRQRTPSVLKPPRLRRLRVQSGLSQLAEFGTALLNRKLRCTGSHPRLVSLHELDLGPAIRSCVLLALRFVEFVAVAFALLDDLGAVTSFESVLVFLGFGCSFESIFVLGSRLSVQDLFCAQLVVGFLDLVGSFCSCVLESLRFCVLDDYGQLGFELSDLIFVALFHGFQLLLVAFGQTFDVVVVRLFHCRGLDGGLDGADSRVLAS